MQLYLSIAFFLNFLFRDRALQLRVFGRGGRERAHIPGVFKIPEQPREPACKDLEIARGDFEFHDRVP